MSAVSRIGLATAILAALGCSRGASEPEHADANVAPATASVVAGMHLEQHAGGLRAELPSGVRATFGSGSVRVDIGDDRGGFGLHVDELRRGDHRVALTTAAPRIEPERIALDRGEGVSEWWKTNDGQLEVGWTLARRVSADVDAPLTIPLVFDGASVEVADGAVVLRRGDHFAARMHTLEVRDARGELITSRFAARDGRAEIVVDDRDAVYPLTVDPILGVMTQLVPTPPAAAFGTRVAIDGDVAVVTSYSGGVPVAQAAHIYRRSGTTWALEQTLTSTRNNFSNHLSLSGNTLIVGDVLYEKTGSSWVQVSTLSSIGGAVSGNTLAVLNTEVTYDANASSVVVWTRGATSWAQSANIATGPCRQLAFAGSTLAVTTRSSSMPTADNIGSVKVYTGAGSTWTLRSTFTPTSGDRYFGDALSVVDDTIAIRANESTSGGWSVVYLGSPVGTSLQRIALTAAAPSPSVAVASGLVILGSGAADIGTKTDAGQTLIYARSGSTWSLRDTLSVPVPFNYDNFGGSVAVSGERAIIGASGYSNGGTWMPTSTRGMAFELHPVLGWPNGHACTVSGTCASGSCVDGVCCDTACTESCKACNLPGSAGTCTAVAADTMPVGGRICAPAKRCAAGGVCATTCTVPEECASGACIAGKCEGKRGNGSPCGKAADCTSNFCVDGVCCDTACTSQCMACDVPSKQGTCWSVTGAPHPNGGARAACAGPGAGTPCGSSCNGSDGLACHYAPAGAVSCGTDSCDAATRIETRRGTCDGAGACSGSSVSCGAYACAALTCKTTCATNTDCAPGYVCGTDSLCKAISTLGVACTKPTDCESPLSCVDGACCAESSCPAGSSCNLPGSKGQCRKQLGVACTSPAECGAGRSCVDGVCCDKACNGTCEACDVPGKEGTCVPVSGAPRLSHGECPASADLCGARQCDGNARATCEAFATAKGTECKAAACVEGGVQPRSTCDGAGACLTPSVQKCGNYVCADGSCKTSCAKAEDCAAGFVCGPDGRCVEGARCSEDGLSTIAKDGTPRACAPYRCGPAGLCSNECSSSEECAPGNTCDTAAHTCIAAAAAEESGGCAMNGRGGSRWLITLALAAALVGRRRRS